jgi:hypothetical protein
VSAGGNPDVEFEMPDAARSSVLVNHDDDERAFGCTAGAEKSLATANELARRLWA